MKLFKGSEVVFGQTYFPSKPDNVLEIKTDSIVRSLALSEVPETGGSFSFAKEFTGFSNRIIFWRSEGSRLYLNEINATRDFADSSLYIDFAPSTIIHGTFMALSRDILILCVPTQSCIHRFRIRLAGKTPTDKSFTSKSVLSFFPRDHIGAVHDVHYFNNGAIASNVSISLDNVGNAYCAVVLKTQLLLVTMKMQGPQKDTYEETYLKEGFGLRLWNSSENEVSILSVVSTYYDNDVYLFSVHSDGKLKVWRSSTKAVEHSYDLVSFLRQDAAVDVESVQMKLIKEFKKTVLVLKVQLLNKVKFLLFEFSDLGLDFKTNNDLEKNLVVDFIVSKGSKENQSFFIWACNRESYQENNKEISFQPYKLWKCQVSLTNKIDSAWESIENSTPTNAEVTLAYGHSTIESIKKHIFDGDYYAFEMVQRAAQTICKAPGADFEYKDWQKLSQFVENFINGGQFKQLFLTEEDQHSLAATNTLDEAKMKAARLKFWRALEKCCSQFQEQFVNPIGLWHCPVLGLVGCIQQVRFTVYLGPDEKMHHVVKNNREVLAKFFQLSESYLTGETNYLEVSSTTVEFMTNHMDLLIHVLDYFQSKNPHGTSGDLVPLKSDFLGSPFSAGFLSAALRHRIFDRLLFAKVVQGLIKLAEDQNKKPGNPNTSYLVCEKLSSQILPINSLAKYYTTLWHSLSTRFLSRQRNKSKVLNVMNVAESYFKYGGCVISSRTLEEEIMDFDYESDSENETEEKTEFIDFSSTALHDAILTLWPDSTAMAFPQFLAKNKFFEQLMEYCRLNEPYVTSLFSAFNFFKGIALSGLNRPAEASKAFEEAAQRLDDGDEALNRVLTVYSYSKKVFPERHDFCDYFATVMNIFKSDNHSEFVIRSGMFALKSATPDKDSVVLPHIYTTLFSQYVSDKRYYDAILVIHQNPCKVTQMSCLRSLIGTLIDLKETKALVQLHYGDLAGCVAEMLETRCKSQSPLTENGLYNVVYAFYMQKYSFDLAARIMYELCWRLKFEPQSRDVLEKRCRVLACVCETMEIVQHNNPVVFSFDLTQFEEQIRRIAGDDGSVKELKPLQPTRAEILEEFLLLEARLALLDTGHFPEGPPIEEYDVYKAAIEQKNYDLAFVLQKNFKLSLNDLITSLTFDCLDLGLSEPKQTSQWVVNNRRFVENLSQFEALPQHWRILVTYLDLAMKGGVVAEQDSFVLRNVLELFLERGIEVPEWLKSRYMKTNIRDFIAELIEFDKIPYGLEVINDYLSALIPAKLQPSQLHSIPFVLVNELLRYGQTKEHSFKSSELLQQTRSLLKKVVHAARLSQLS